MYYSRTILLSTTFAQGCVCKALCLISTTTETKQKQWPNKIGNETKQDSKTPIMHFQSMFAFRSQRLVHWKDALKSQRAVLLGSYRPWSLPWLHLLWLLTFSLLWGPVSHLFPSAAMMKYTSAAHDWASPEVTEKLSLKTGFCILATSPSNAWVRW